MMHQARFIGSVMLVTSPQRDRLKQLKYPEHAKLTQLGCTCIQGHCNLLLLCRDEMSIEMAGLKAEADKVPGKLVLDLCSFN